MESAENRRYRPDQPSLPLACSACPTILPATPLLLFPGSKKRLGNPLERPLFQCDPIHGFKKAGYRAEFRCLENSIQRKQRLFKETI